MYRDEKKEYQLEQILNKIEEADGIVKTSDILALGIDYRRVQTFVKEGELRKIRNGSYTSGRKSYPEEDLITALFPDGVLTLNQRTSAYRGYFFCFVFITHKIAFHVNYLSLSVITGTVMVTVVPTPTPDSISREPLWSCIISSATASPIPEPRTVWFAL